MIFGSLNPVTSYNEKRVIGYSCQHMYDIVSNVGAYPQFVPWVTTSRILKKFETNSKESKLTAELGVGFQTISEKYTSQVSLIPGKQVHASASNSALFALLENTWSFHPATDISIDTQHR